MMFDLKIQAAKEPALHSAAPSKIHSRFNLMDRPRILYRLGTLSRQRELGLFNAMSKLEYNANNQAGKSHGKGVDQQHQPDRMKQKRQPEGQCEEQRFTTHKPD